MSFDETMASLDQLLQADAARKEGPLALLRSAVSRLDGEPLPPSEAPQGDPGLGHPRRLTPDEAPWVPLPRRKTHGGRFGPAVVAKLRAEALGKR